MPLSSTLHAALGVGLLLGVAVEVYALLVFFSEVAFGYVRKLQL
jgi:hypothetical protein